MSEKLTIELPPEFEPGKTSLISIYDEHGFQIKSVVELRITLNCNGLSEVSLVHVLGEDWLPLEDVKTRPLNKPDGSLVYDRREYQLAGIRVREPEKEST